MNDYVQQGSHTTRAGKNLAQVRRSTIVRLAGAAILVSMFGCGKSSTIVTGVVTLDGKPLEGAIVEFRPVAGDGWTTSVLSEPGGRYRAIIAPVPMMVVIAKDEVAGKMPAPTSGPAANAPGGVPDRVVQILPPRYSDRSKSELRVTPLEGKTTQADFALASGNE